MRFQIKQMNYTLACILPSIPAPAIYERRSIGRPLWIKITGFATLAIRHRLWRAAVGRHDINLLRFPRQGAHERNLLGIRRPAGHSGGKGRQGYYGDGGRRREG